MTPLNYTTYLVSFISLPDSHELAFFYRRSVFFSMCVPSKESWPLVEGFIRKVEIVGRKQIKGAVFLQFSEDDKRLLEVFPDLIHARMVIYFEKLKSVAEFPLRIEKHELMRGFNFEFETTTAAQNDFQTAIEVYSREPDSVKFKIGILHNGLVIKAFELRKGKCSSQNWF